MFRRKLHEEVEGALASADVRIDGHRPWDLAVHDDRFYARIASEGALGLGESYMDGWWDCPDLAQFFCKILQGHLDRGPSGWMGLLAKVRARLTNLQRKSRAAENVHRHYDHGNQLYRNMLGRWMLYSSANWENATTLDAAGEAKFEFVCRRLNLQPGQNVLDIGCGWGGFAKFAAQRYGVHVVGITLSAEQLKLAREICSDLPVEIRHQDYRDLSGQFDRIVSLGMFEHVGYKNYREYMKMVRHCLRPDGLFFLNTIGANQTEYCLNPWADKYIFPGAMLPSMVQISTAIDRLFVIEELQDCAEFYDRTLRAWFERFRSNWNKLRASYGDRFYRMWTYYLLSSAGAFRSRSIRDWHIVLSP